MLARGARRVRDGSLEVVFGELTPPVLAESGKPVVISLSGSEREELDDLRRQRRMAEEMP